MSVRRLAVPIPHVADVIPRGARNPRGVCFRTEATVEIRTASASEIGLAVVIGDERSIGGSGRRYVGFEGALWLPVEIQVGRPIGHEAALAAIAAGSRTVGSMPNPFLRVGRSLQAGGFPGACAIEEMPLRAIVADDRNDRIARANRVAADLLLVEGDRVLRRSVGPFWRTGRSVRPFPVNPEFDLPGLGAVYFGIARHEEALEFASTEWSVGQASDKVDIRMPECVPDHDALLAARAVANFDAIQAMHRIAKHVPEEADLRGTLHAAGSLYGRDVGELARGIRDYPACPGMPPATPEQMVAAAEGVRDFFGRSFEMGGADVRQFHALSWDLFEKSVGAHVRRFDVHERDRLPVSDAAPDLEPLPAEMRP